MIVTDVLSQNLAQSSDGHGWIDMADKPVFGQDKRFYFIRLPLADGTAGHFRHVAMINTSVSTGAENDRDLETMVCVWLLWWLWYFSVFSSS